MSYVRYVYREATDEVDEHIFDEAGNYECYTLKGAVELLNDKQNVIDDVLKNCEYERRMHIKFKRENEALKQRIIELDEVKWLRENTVWESMPTSRRIFTQTNGEFK